MRIGVNTRVLIKDQLEGIGYYSHELLRRIVRKHPEHQFYFFFDRMYSDDFIYAENVIPVILSPQARHPVLWYIWFERAVKKALRRYNIDLFFSPDGHLSLSTGVPTVLTMHDLAYIHFPMMVPSLVRRYYSYFVPRFLGKAKKVITVSNFVKQDILQHFNLPEDRIISVYNAATEGYLPLPEEEKAAIRNKWSEGSPYFLYAGAIHPRKNIIQLIKGFEQFKSKANKDFKLLLAGKVSWLSGELQQYHNNSAYRKDIIFLGRLSQTDLNKVMGAAYAFCYISRMEGFGIPLVEAMQCHVPIICSNKGSLPEVCGNAGIIIDPDNTGELCRAMCDLVFSKEIYDSFSRKAAERKSYFSWDKAADQVANVLFDPLILS